MGLSGTMRGQDGAAATSPAPATAPAMLEVRVMEVKVRSAAYAEAAARIPSRDLAKNGEPSPMTMMLQIHSPDDLVTATVSLDSAVDDAGKDLLAGAKVSPGPPFMAGLASNISADFHEGFVHLSFAQAPTSGAREITISGMARVQVGRGTAVMKKRIALAVGTSFLAGRTTFKIGDVFRGSTSSVWVSYVQMPPTLIRTMEFTDGADRIYAGKPTEIRTSGPGVSLVYSFKDLPAEAEVQVTLFEKAEAVRVPFTLKIGIGY